jgi:hypothetical protein
MSAEVQPNYCLSRNYKKRKMDISNMLNQSSELCRTIMGSQLTAERHSSFSTVILYHSMYLPPSYISANIPN